MKRLLILSIVVVFLTGCVTTWKQVGGPYNSDQINYTIDLPNGWMQHANTKYLLVTRDGVLLQNIIINRFDIGEELAYSKKKFRQDMLPHEQAELMADNFSANPDVLNFKLLENRPMSISGHKGFRLVFTFKNKDGLRLKSIYNGFMIDNWFYFIRFNAAARFYFDRDVGEFEKAFSSFKLYSI